MRFTSSAALLIAVALMAGCTSSGGVEDVLAQRPSTETTASISRPMPSADVGAIIAAAEPQMQAAAVTATPPMVAESLAPVDKPEPSEQAIAMIAPAKPQRVAQQAKVYSHRFRDAKPINFGKISPKSYPVHGVDVSRWQGNIDWVKLRSQGANFVYIKATDGGDHLDPMFRKNWRDAKEAGLKRGAYHFFYWCRAASDQADWFIRNVPKTADALPPVIDVEWNGESRCKKRPSRARVLEKMQVFMDRLEAHYGQRPVIYTAPDFYKDNLSGELKDYPFWLRAVAQHPSKVYPGRKWVFWQYSGSGLSHGVTGRIDLNVFAGSEKEWRKWLGRNTRGGSDDVMASAD